MAETYGELITRLCQLRDAMRATAPGREALQQVRDELAAKARAQKAAGGVHGRWPWSWRGSGRSGTRRCRTLKRPPAGTTFAIFAAGAATWTPWPTAVRRAAGKAITAGAA